MNASCDLNEQDDLVGQAVEEYFKLLSTGGRPELESFLARFPDIRDILKSVIPALQLADASVGEPMLTGLHEQRQIGDFRILRQIGRGGMGIVYEAEQISMGRRVALKVLPLAGLVDENKIRRFQNEVRAVAALDHPNIVSVYLVGEERGIHYFAMQLIRGRSLAQVISSLQELRALGNYLDGDSVCEASGQNKSKLNNESVGKSTIPSHMETVARADDSTTPALSTPSHAQSREYFRSIAVLGIQAANAIQHAHDHGIIHRDIKPANLLLDSMSKLYVTDFGLARVGSDVGMTMTGDFLGTLRYMPPEQAFVDRALVDQRADVYSLGVTLYEMLTLQPAFTAEDRGPLLHQIANEDPTPLRRIDKSIPTELETIIHKAIAKDICDRYSSSAELADDLRCFLDNRPIKAKPPTLWQSATKWSRRNPILVWASLITLSLVTLTLGTSTLAIMQQRNAALHVSDALRSTLYASEMNAAYQAWATGNVPRAKRLLVRQIPSENAVDLRGIEWYFLASRCKANRGEAIVRTDSVWCLSPDGKTVATVIDNAVVIVDQETKRRSLLVERVQPEQTRVGLAFSPSGQHLAFVDGDMLRIVHLTTKQEFQVPGVSRHRLAFSPDGRWGANVTDDRAVQIWHTDSGKVEWSQPGHGESDMLKALEFSPDSQHLVTAYHQEAMVHVWQVADGMNRTIELDDDARHLVEQVLFLSNETFLLCGADGVHCFDIDDEDSSPSTSIRLPPTRFVYSMAVSPNGKTLALGTESNAIELWDLETGVQLWRQIRTSRVQQVAFADDRNLILSLENAIERCEFGDHTTRLPVESRLDWPESIATHGDNVIVPGPSYQLVVWNTASGSHRVMDFNDDFKAERHPTVNWAATVAVSPDGTTIASTGAGKFDRIIRIWDAESGDLIDRYKTDDFVHRVAYSPNGRTLAAVSTSHLTLWDTATAKTKWVGPEQESPVSVCFSPDGKWLATGGGPWNSGGEVMVWNMEGAAPQLAFQRPHKEIVLTVAISPDSRFLVAGDYSGAIVVYDLIAKSSCIQLDGHSMALQSFLFSADGRTFASASYDGVVKFWQMGSWRELGEFNNGDPVAAIRLLSTPSNGLGLVVGTRRNASAPADVQVHWIDTSQDWDWLKRE